MTELQKLLLNANPVTLTARSRHLFRSCCLNLLIYTGSANFGAAAFICQSHLALLRSVWANPVGLHVALEKPGGCFGIRVNPEGS